MNHNFTRIVQNISCFPHLSQHVLFGPCLGGLGSLFSPALSDGPDVPGHPPQLGHVPVCSQPRVTGNSSSQDPETGNRNVAIYVYPYNKINMTRRPHGGPMLAPKRPADRSGTYPSPAQAHTDQNPNLQTSDITWFTPLPLIL